MSAHKTVPSDQLNKHAYYVAIWQGMLEQLLGWPEAQSVAWISQYEESLEDPESLIYHQSPQYWVAPVLIPEEMRLRLSALEALSLRNRILAVFSDSNHYWFPADTDWRVYKDRLEAILSEYDS